MKNEIRDKVPPEGCDLLLILFVLSAVNPKNMDIFMEHALEVGVVWPSYLGLKERRSADVPRLWSL